MAKGTMTGMILHLLPAAEDVKETKAAAGDKPISFQVLIGRLQQFMSEITSRRTLADLMAESDIAALLQHLVGNYLVVQSVDGFCK